MFGTIFPLGVLLLSVSNYCFFVILPYLFEELTIGRLVNFLR
jgi:hypothetical protein